MAGLKLNGKNPTNAPPRAVINKIAINGESLSVNIISKERHEVKHIPEESPSKPSI